jgi:hypothetical protein
MDGKDGPKQPGSVAAPVASAFWLTCVSRQPRAGRIKMNSPKTVGSELHSAKVVRRAPAIRCQAKHQIRMPGPQLRDGVCEGLHSEGSHSSRECSSYASISYGFHRHHWIRQSFKAHHGLNGLTRVTVLTQNLIAGVPASPNRREVWRQQKEKSWY